jgi:hypothetical protein
MTVAIKATEPCQMTSNVNVALYLSGADLEKCNDAHRWIDDRLGRPTTIKAQPMSDSDMSELLHVAVDYAAARSRRLCSCCAEPNR